MLAEIASEVFARRCAYKAEHGAEPLLTVCMNKLAWDTCIAEQTYPLMVPDDVRIERENGEWGRLAGATVYVDLRQQKAFRIVER